MRIVIASTYVPFRNQGEVTLVHNLAAALAERDYLVDTVLLPLDWGRANNETAPLRTEGQSHASHRQGMAEQTLAIRSLDLTESSGNKIDLLITLRTPAEAIPHPNKVAWFRDHPRGPVTRYDAKFLPEAKRIYARSRTAAKRLKESRGIDAHEVFYPPLLRPDRAQGADYGDYFLYLSRVTVDNRQALAIQAMKHAKSSFKLIVAGQADPETYGAELQRLVRLLDLEDRVQLLGWVSEEQKAALMANACAVLYLPADTDSCGYVTLEAFQAGKPVITLADSNGPTEIIEDSVNGLIVEPLAEALAAGMEKLWRAKTRTALMGRNAYDTFRLHDICWDRIVEALVA
jgi:glycosyltransferase involved in cell wall biosynthesis